MLIYQGAKAFEIWTGKKPDTLQMKIAALEEMAEKSLEEIGQGLEKALGKSFQLKTTDKASYEAWREATYGETKDADQAQEDADWGSLMGTYFADADMEP